MRNRFCEKTSIEPTIDSNNILEIMATKIFPNTWLINFATNLVFYLFSYFHFVFIELMNSGQHSNLSCSKQTKYMNNLLSLIDL